MAKRWSMNDRLFLFVSWVNDFIGIFRKRKNNSVEELTIRKNRRKEEEEGENDDEERIKRIIKEEKKWSKKRNKVATLHWLLHSHSNHRCVCVFVLTNRSNNSRDCCKRIRLESTNFEEHWYRRLSYFYSIQTVLRFCFADDESERNERT